MSISPRQIEFLARAVVNRLEDRGLAEFSDAEAGIDVVSKVLSANFRQLDVLESEVWERAITSGEDSDVSAIEDEIRRLADERGITL